MEARIGHRHLAVHLARGRESAGQHAGKQAAKVSGLSGLAGGVGMEVLFGSSGAFPFGTVGSGLFC